MTILQLRKQIEAQIDQLDFRQLEALLKVIEVLKAPEEEFVLSDDDYAIIRRRMSDFQHGTEKGLSAKQVVERGKNA